MEERKLSWPERGKLWARLGIRLALLVLALWLLQAVFLYRNIFWARKYCCV